MGTTFSQCVTSAMMMPIVTQTFLQLPTPATSKPMRSWSYAFIMLNLAMTKVSIPYLSRYQRMFLWVQHT